MGELHSGHPHGWGTCAPTKWTSAPPRWTTNSHSEGGREGAGSTNSFAQDIHNGGSHDYRSTRDSYRARYWHNMNRFDVTPEAASSKVDQIHRSGKSVVAVHMRNGDVSDNRPGAHAKRYVQAKKYRPFLAEVAALRGDCVAVVIVTENGQDRQVQEVVHNFNKDSKGRIDISILDDKKCDAICGMRTFTHSEVLIAGFSGFSYVGAMLSDDSQIVASPSSERERQEQTGRSWVREPSRLRAELRSRLQCAH